MSQAKLLLLWHKVKPMVARWIAVSEQVGKECQQELGLEPRRVVVVPNGIDTHRFRPDTIARQQSRARLGIADDVPLLIATGRLEYEKGFHITIHALQRIRKRYPKAQLIIAGDGVSRPMLERLAEQTAPGAVHFTGHVPNEDLPALLAAADVYLMPTLRNEGMPMTIIEALAVGLPVIASRVGGVPSTITDGETGLLIPVGHTQALAQATIRVLEDDQLRLRLAHAARAIAERLYSQTHMVAESERVLLAAIA
jgi:glycosyltransferase involved in cell wall biosynthesis